MGPVQLLPKYVERVWGAESLAPLFPPQGTRIGEVWLSSNDVETSEGVTLGELQHRPGVLGSKVAPAPGGRFPVLIKFLFTTEKLSVQVHPDDEYSIAHHGQPGKTEMWYVLKAAPDAVIAQGFKEEYGEARLRDALSDGTVEALLRWWPASAGQTYFTPAKTVHAIGGGLAICEIQQNSDVTYRLWDYGRPRELHVESSIAVLDWGPAAGPQRPGPFCDEGQLLASCRYFATEHHTLQPDVHWDSDAERFHILVICGGKGVLKFQGEETQLKPGMAWLIPAQMGEYILDGTPELELLRVYVPSR